MLDARTPLLQYPAKRWRLGCVIPRPGSFWPRGEFTQPSLHLLSGYCRPLSFTADKKMGISRETHKCYVIVGQFVRRREHVVSHASAENLRDSCDIVSFHYRGRFRPDTYQAGPEDRLHTATDGQRCCKLITLAFTGESIRSWTSFCWLHIKNSAAVLSPQTLSICL